MVGHSYNPKSSRSKPNPLKSSTSQANSKFSTSKAKPKKETAEKWTSDQAHHYSLMCAPVRPNNPHPLSDENRLHHVPDDMRLDYNRPWFSLDYIDLSGPLYPNTLSVLLVSFLDASLTSHYGRSSLYHDEIQRVK